MCALNTTSLFENVIAKKKKKKKNSPFSCSLDLACTVHHTSSTHPSPAPLFSSPSVLRAFVAGFVVC